MARDLSGLEERLEDLYDQGGFRAVVAQSPAGASGVQVRAGAFAWTLDEPADLGGMGSGPDPVTSFLGALCSCLVISLKMAARARQITLESVEARAIANEKGFVREILVDLTVHSSEPEEKVKALLERAERGCYLRRLLKEEIHYRQTLNLVV